MRLFFSNSLRLFSEKSGRMVWELDKVDSVSESADVDAVERKEKEDKVKIGTNLEQKVLKTEVEKEVIEKAELEAIRIRDEMRAEIESKLPEHEAMQLNPREYAARLEDIVSGRKYKEQISAWKRTHLKLLPDDYEDNIKLGGIIGIIAFGATEGGMKKRMFNAAKFGSLAAALAHPTLTSGLAGIMAAAGRDIAGPGVEGILNLVVEAIDNPRRLIKTVNASMKSGKPFSETPIYELLRHGRTASESMAKTIETEIQNRYALQANGLVIGDANLRHVVNAVDLAEQNEKNGVPAIFDKSAIEPMATFILQMADHRLSEDDKSNLDAKIAGRGNTVATPKEVRLALVNNMERDMLKFFEKNGLMGELNAEMAKQKLEANNVPIEKLELAKAIIDSTADDGSQGFDLTRQKHGVERFMSMGAGGMALSLYVLSFLTISGVMKLRGLVQPQTWKEKVPNAAKKIFKIATAPLAALGRLVKKNQPKGMLKEYGKTEKLFSKAERKEVWKSMNDEDKEKLVTQTKTFIDREEKEKDGKFRYDQLPSIIDEKLKVIREKNAPEVPK